MGNEEWRRFFSDKSSGEVVCKTEDGGYAVLIQNENPMLNESYVYVPHESDIVDGKLAEKGIIMEEPPFYLYLIKTDSNGNTMKPSIPVDSARSIITKRLIKKNVDIRFDVYGMNNVQPIWGEQFIKRISNCYMGINLSRGKPIKYYSSDRIAQLIGNGLLTFIDKKTKFNKFFNNDEVIFYDSISDLSKKIIKYSINENLRKKIAKRGQKKYLKYFNSKIVADFIINKSFEINNNKKYLWHNN